ncbi:MAG: nucleoside recognition protein [Clostridiales bacterium]|nr:nucleoside recognition protein [Clostridiales bacterium]
MSAMEIIKEGLLGGLTSVYSIALIVFPLMVFMEIAKDIGALDWLAKSSKPITRFMKISDNSAFPLAIGLVFGLAFGAGVIIQSAKEGNLDKRSLLLVALFLACCHAVFEDTLLFVAVGANGWFLLAIRTVTAFALTAIVSKRIKIKPDKGTGTLSDK